MSIALILVLLQLEKANFIFKFLSRNGTTI